MSNKRLFQKKFDNLDLMHMFRQKFAQVMIYSRAIALALGILVIALVLFFGYRWYVVKRDRAAQVAFSTVMIDVQESMRNKDTDFNNLVDKLEVHYKQNANSSFAPYLLLAEVDVLLQQGNKQQALDRLGTVVSELNNTSLAYLAKIKYALLSLDIAYEQSPQDMQAQESLVKELTTLAYDQHNYYRDYALYYLGRYYFATGNMSEAKRVWQDLIDSQRIEKMHQSPWAALAQAKIEQIV